MACAANSRNDQRHHKRQQRAQKQLAADMSQRGFDIGKRICQTDRSTRHRSGHVKKRNSDRPAAAGVGADIAFQGSHELGTLGMVFHGRWLSLGVRQNLALQINNRRAGPGGPAFFQGGIAQEGELPGGGCLAPIERGQRAHAIHLNGEHLCLLPEIELDLLEERFFPGMVNREIEGHRGRANHQDEGAQQLEKYPFPHFGASKR